VHNIQVIIQLDNSDWLKLCVGAQSTFRHALHLEIGDLEGLNLGSDLLARAKEAGNGFQFS
jgi:hypothetical protein